MIRDPQPAAIAGSLLAVALLFAVEAAKTIPWVGALVLLSTCAAGGALVIGFAGQIIGGGARA